jgi:hypothetical protein
VRYQEKIATDTNENRYNMDNQFTNVMAQRTDAELLKIVNELRSDYQPDALGAAEKELSKRNLSTLQIQEASKENQIKHKIDAEKATTKLGGGWKTLAFIFPGIILIIFSGAFKADGYDRKARELTKWTLYGIGFYLGLIVLISILNRL